ncbi:MAG: class I SAM-dependent RNA methyltransferase, partial [Paludibacteraceae bacterium]|nr:class I SAM-dependent RNA methyltransferase [Paludibacteraceae bacterium]
MSRKNKQQPVLEGITITDVAAEGKALARVDDCVVFVPYAVPGDVVDLQVTRKKHKYMEARVLRIITPSPLRIVPPCPHFGVCGGCKWQILPYEEQLKHKQRQVFDNLTRIGHIELPEIMPILGSRNVYAYRNKLEFTFSNRKWRTWEDIQERGELTEPADIYGLGFHIPTAFDKVLDISQCLLMDDVNNRIRNHIRRFAIQHGMTFFNLRTQEGLLRNLIVRNSNKGELMLIVVFGQDDEASREMLMADIASAFPEITSLLYVVNTKCNDVIADLPVHVYRG